MRRPPLRAAPCARGFRRLGDLRSGRGRDPGSARGLRVGPARPAGGLDHLHHPRIAGPMRMDAVARETRWQRLDEDAARGARLAPQKGVERLGVAARGGDAEDDAALARGRDDALRPGLPFGERRPLPDVVGAGRHDDPARPRRGDHAVEQRELIGRLARAQPGVESGPSAQRGQIGALDDAVAEEERRVGGREGRSIHRDPSPKLEGVRLGVPAHMADRQRDRAADGERQQMGCNRPNSHRPSPVCLPNSVDRDEWNLAD